jgi:methyltransferase
VVIAAHLALVGVGAAERLVELGVARRNAAWAIGAGGVEQGRGHYPGMVALHALLLAGAAIEPILLDRPFVPARFVGGGLALLLAAGLRFWVIRSLGRRWTTRVIVLPGRPLIATGPYRYLRHPNYLAVVIEVAALPIAVGALVTAIAASLMNAALLAVRIRTEEAALGIRTPS